MQIEQVFSLDSLKYAKDPEVARAVQHHQLFTRYGAALTPELVDNQPNRYVQLLRHCINAEAKVAKESGQKKKFYSEVGIQQASMARF